MEVTLRKAHQLQKQAQAAAQKLAVANLSVQVSVYDSTPLTTLIANAREKAKKNIDDALALIDATFTIRRLINEANATNGINPLLVEKAALDQKERLLGALANGATLDNDASDTESSIETAARKLASLGTRLESASAVAGRYGAEERVAISIYTQADIDGYTDQLAAARDRKTAINDELMQKNWQTKVTLDKRLADLLKSHKIRV